MPRDFHLLVIKSELETSEPRKVISILKLVNDTMYHGWKTSLLWQSRYGLARRVAYVVRASTYVTCNRCVCVHLTVSLPTSPLSLSVSFSVRLSPQREARVVAPFPVILAS